MNPDHDRPEPPRPRRCLAAHWRGDLPLSLSFWGNYVLLALATSLALGALTTWTHFAGESLRVCSIALLIGWPLALALEGWGAVGAWRSAGAHPGRDGSVAVARAAKFALVLGVLATLASAGVNFGPQVGSYLRVAQGIDPLGQVRAVVSTDGRRLRLEGHIGMGDAARVRRLLASAPKARLVELDSPGGRLDQASRIAEAVRGRQTRAVGSCENACALVFMAGAGRQMMPGARLGFHRLATGTFNPIFGKLANRELADSYRRAGLPETFITKASSTAPSWTWYPDADEIAAAGLIGVMNRPLDIYLPAPEGAQPRDYADALGTHPTWVALERRFPGSIAAAAERMQAARTGGAVDEAVMVAGLRVVEALLPKLLHRAGPELRDQFTALLAEQLGAVRSAGNDACRSLLSGDAALRRSLPTPLALRESTWLIDAAAEPVRENAGRRTTTLEFEVARRSLSDRAPALLAGLWGPGQREHDCAKAAEILDAVARLPWAERKLALRLIFERT